MTDLSISKRHPPSSTELGEALAQIPELNLAFDEDAATSLLARDGTLFLASLDGQFAGLKAGYDRYRDGNYYSWLGGVVPGCRRSGVAQALLDAQEAWVREAGYCGIYVKTRNRFVGMRILLARNGYEITGVEAPSDESRAEIRLMHYKRIPPAD